MQTQKSKIVSLAVAALVMLLPGLHLADAQQPTNLPRIGFISAGDPKSTSSLDEGFRQGLRDLGYIEGKNVLVEYRYAQGKVDRYPGFVAELVQLKVDVLVAIALTSIRAAKQATTTIPIVMITTADPVATGLIDSLARPGGNITGLTRLTRELGGKRLELLKEAVPRVSRVGVLMDVDAPGPAIAFKEYEAAAKALKISLQSIEMRGSNPDFEVAFDVAIKGRASGLVVISGSLFNNNGKRIADLATKNRLPSMHERSDYVEAWWPHVLCNERR
jgi:putative ABC transport system substrate-binding protein